MEKIWNNILIAGIICLTVIGQISINTAFAQKQAIPPFYTDRWDPGGNERDTWAPQKLEPGLQNRMTRHWAFMHGGMPSKYRGLVNPLEQTKEQIKSGGILYYQECAQCHGEHGMGDGEIALALTPSPALLAYMIQMPMSVDEYLMWSIAEGGQAFGTNMPAFKDKLSSDQIWGIISFMRAGFPSPFKDDKQ